MGEGMLRKEGGKREGVRNWLGDVRFLKDHENMYSMKITCTYHIEGIISKT